MESKERQNEEYVDEKYVVSLRELSEGVYEREYLLDDAFFEAVGATETRRGEVKTTVTLRKGAQSTEIEFTTEGYVYVPCDRCMEDMQVDINGENKLVVRYGESFEEVDDELVVIPEYPGEIDLSWYMYEFIALAIPIRHVHPEGECDAEVVNRLKSYMVDKVEDDRHSDGLISDEDDEGGEVTGDGKNENSNWAECLKDLKKKIEE